MSRASDKHEERVGFLDVMCERLTTGLTYFKEWHFVNGRYVVDGVPFTGPQIDAIDWAWDKWFEYVREVAVELGHDEVEIEDEVYVLNDEDSDKVISMLREPLSVEHMMYTNTGCALKVYTHDDSLGKGDRMLIVTPVGAEVPGTLREVEDNHLVIDAEGDTVLRAYFHQEDCPDL